MKKILRQSLSAFLAVLMVLLFSSPVFAQQPKQVEGTDQQTLQIAVLSDTHYLATALIKDTEDYERHLNSDRKMFTEGDAFLRALLSTVRADKPDVLLICGDLTKDGELESHQELAGILEDFEKSTGVKVYVVPGNHDLNNSNGMNFNTSDSKAVPATRTSQEAYLQTYQNLVYGDETIVARFTPSDGKQGGGLSYVACPKDGYTIIGIDSACYSADNTNSGTDEHETRGTVSPELEAWILDQIKQAHDRGDTVIGFEHHGMIPHFDMEPDLLPMYLVDVYDRLSQEYADAGMACIFTGHMHANDISQITTPAGNTFTDIETGSVLTYPSPARMVTITRTITHDEVTEDIKVHSYLHTSAGTFTNRLTGEQQTVDDISAYGKEHGFSQKMLTTTACSFLAGVAENPGTGETIRGLISKAMYKNDTTQWDTIIRDVIRNNIDEKPQESKAQSFDAEEAEEIWNEDNTASEEQTLGTAGTESVAAEESADGDVQPTDGNSEETELTDAQLEEAVKLLEGKESVTESDVEQAIYQVLSENSASSQMPRRASAASSSDNGVTVYRDSSDNIQIEYVKKIIFSTIQINATVTPEGIADTLDHVFSTLDMMSLSEETSNKLIGDLVNDLTSVEVAKDGETSKTLLDYANFIYQSHLGGEDSEPQPQWVQDARALLESGQLTDQLIDIVIHNAAAIIDELLKTMNVSEFTGIAGMTKNGVVASEGRIPLFTVTKGSNLLRSFLPLACPKLFETGKDTFNPDYSMMDLINDLAKFMKKEWSTEDQLQKLINGTEATETEEAKEGILKQEQKDQITAFALSVVDTLGRDTNYAEDNETAFSRTWTLTTPAHVFGDWEKNAEEHWKICTVCGEKAESGAHTFGDWEVTKEATYSQSGERVHTCTVCGYVEKETIPVAGITRYAGRNRYKTSIAIADALKEQLQLDKFDTAVIASGEDYADALSGSYLAIQKNAPLLIVNKSSLGIITDYIKNNVQEGGKIYILGGPAVVSEDVESTLAGYDCTRLYGRTRYDTCLAILNEAGVKDNSNVMVCSGKNYADALSASATGNPVLLVNDTLNEAQKNFLAIKSGLHFTIFGGESVVSADVAKDLSEYGSVDRIAGKDRYETAALAAENYTTDTVVLTYGLNYPDGLCGGPLAHAFGAPVMLTTNNAINQTAAQAAATKIGATKPIVLGGETLVSDDSVLNIINEK
jgi:putative cell wall-binding protein